MSDDKRFVNLTKGSGSSWADEDDHTNAPAEPKAAKTWGSVATVKAVSIADQLADEAKKEAQKEQPPPRRDDRPPREPRGDRDFGNRGGDRDYGNRGGGDRDYGNREPRGDRDYGNREPRGDREQREPRPKNPVPDHPPYVAFLGNLAYSVNEDVIMEFFGELGVDQIRMVNDSQTGKPKGFAYVHFTERAGLENALTCDGMDFYGRRLNVDVAASKPREERGQWGPRDGASSGGARRGFGERGFGDRGDRDFAPRGPPAERKPLQLAPRTKPLDSDGPAAAHSADVASAAPKAGGADPFGGATADRAKMDKIAEERLKREQEREAKRKEEIRSADERRQREREERDRSREAPSRGRGGPRGGARPEHEAPPKSDKEVEIDSRNSWRSERKAGEGREAPSGRGGFGGGRGGGRGGAAAGGASRAPEKKWVEDSEGFKTKKEEPKPASTAGGSWATVASKGTAAPATEEKNAANPYDALGEQ